MSSGTLPMESKELCHNRYMVSLLTDHMAFPPKYRGKILVRDVVLALDVSFVRLVRILALRSLTWQ